MAALRQQMAPERRQKAAHAFLRRAVEPRRLGDRVLDRSVFADILVQKVEVLVCFVSVDNELVVERDHFRRGREFPQRDMDEVWCVAGNAIDLGFSLTSTRMAPSAILRLVVVGQICLASSSLLTVPVLETAQAKNRRRHASHCSTFSRLGTPPAWTTLPSTTTPGVDMTP